MKFAIPGQIPFEIKTLILDLNGTISVGGIVPDGVKERLSTLKSLGFDIVFFTGNTRDDAHEIAQELDIDWRLAKTAEEKRDLALEIGADTCVSIGNGLIDLELTQVVKLGIVTLQAEGVHLQTLLAADIVIPTINDALDLFLDTDKLIATMRR